jgi:alpha-tubulin suppressor-like RCC1 family protein
MMSRAPLSFTLQSRVCRALARLAPLTLVSLAGAGCTGGAPEDIASIAQAAGARARAPIAASHEISCALEPDGTVRCWGNPFPRTATLLAGVSGATSLANGRFHQCALIADGTVSCWGRNDRGQLGNGTTSPSSTFNPPAPVPGISDAVYVGAGIAHTCALIADGTVRCWGDNDDGQLGDGTLYQRDAPVTVAGIPGAASLDVLGAHTCALIADGTVRCWGRNEHGQVGDGTVTTPHPLPTTVVGLSGVAALGGGGWHTCALLANGTVTCWGFNYSGELGTTTSSNNNPLPLPVPGVSGVVDIAQGAVGQSTCVLLADGTVRCWGDNTYGELGDGTLAQSTTPVTPIGITGAVAISTSGYHACVTLADGTARCWGSGMWGELGDGTTNNHPAPITVLGL